MCVVFVILLSLGWTCLNKKNKKFFKKFNKILKSENFLQEIHVYEFFSQNQKFFELNTEVQPVNEHVPRKQKNFQTDLNLCFFAITAKRNKNKISFYFLRPVNFFERHSAFCPSFFHFSSKRFKTLAFTFWIVMLLKNAMKKNRFFDFLVPLKEKFRLTQIKNGLPSINYTQITLFPINTAYFLKSIYTNLHLGVSEFCWSPLK